MGSVSQSERAELEQIRENLIARIESLQDQLSYGTITMEQAEYQLQQEFGADYRATLAAINDVLHSSQSAHEMIPHKQVAMVVLVALGVLLALGVWAYPSITGAVFAQNTMRVDAVLADGHSRALLVQTPIRVEDVIATYEGDGDFTLSMITGDGRMPLVVGNSRDQSCVGCGASLEPPYELELSASSGSLHVISIRYG